MNRKTIRLTESGLHRLIKESVRKVLKEVDDTYGGMYDNALYFSNTPEEWDERMKDRKKYADMASSLAKHKHPQATPYVGYSPDEKQSSAALNWVHGLTNDLETDIERQHNDYGF